MPPVNTFPTVGPSTTEYTYNGDIEALGPLELTRVAKSFGDLQQGDLEDYFPTQFINERVITIEQEIEGLGTMPIVTMGQPDGNFSEARRFRSFTATPVFLRESDFLSQGLINQLRVPHTANTAYSPAEVVANRLNQLMARRKRTITMLRSMAMLGGINYHDPRTNTSINVSMNVPQANMFSYKGADTATAALSVGAAIPGTPYTVGPGGLIDKGRQEALLFIDAGGRAGVPWTDPQADIIRAVRYLKQFFWKRNKNKAMEIIMSSSLHTVLLDNEFVKAYAQGLGVLGNYSNQARSGLTSISNNVLTPGANSVTFRDGELDSICGLKIRVIDGLYRHPQTNVLTNYWPDHKVVIASPYHFEDRTATFGMTHHPMGESPMEEPGVWSMSAPFHMPPAAPGRAIQVGDACLPFSVYPYWEMIIDVCEAGYITDNLIINSEETYGVF